MNSKIHLTQRHVLVILAVCFYALPLAAQSNQAKRYPIIPYPSRLVPEMGFFSVNKNTKVVLDYSLYKREASNLINLVKQVSGFTLQYGQDTINNCIIIKKDTAIHSEEGYLLRISQEKIVLAASAPAGIFYGMETIRQLLPVATGENNQMDTLSLPSVDITDAPAFAWRGMHLDVARHFFQKTT